MKLKSKQRRWIFFSLLVLSVFFVFFLGRKFDVQKQSRSWNILTNGVQYFRKGLDVSGGTRLVYQISYDKYDQAYQGRESQLANIKKEIENILFKQIDKRISSLGVADAKVYKKTIGKKTYINVDIGGVSDLDQAKKMIGKTVELEFRLPYKGEITDEIKQERKTLALKLQEDLFAHPESFSKLSENKGAQSIYYVHLTGASSAQMPPLLRKNISKINELSEGEIASTVFSGVYSYMQVPTGSGQIGLEPIEGYGIVRLNSKKVVNDTIVTKKRIVNTAEELGLTVSINEELMENKPVQDSVIQATSYHNYQQIVPSGEKMYKVKVAFVSSLLASGNTASIDTIKEKIQQEEVMSGAALVMNNEWKTLADLKSTITTFDPENTENIQVYNEMGANYVVYISKKKTEQEGVYEHIVVNNVPNNFIEKLTKKTVYDIEITFVQDHEPWSLAKTAHGKILNGAYFQRATPGASSLGKPTVDIHFNEEGKQIFCDITNENIKKQMAIFVGGENKTAPVIQTKICGGVAQISGDYTPESAKELAEELNDGALPAPLILLQEEKVSSILGNNALKNALLAGLCGIMAIFVFMIFMYSWKKATISVIVLGMFLLTLGFFMKLTDYALSLSAIAAIILSLGMAVDANILIFERMKEEQERGSDIKNIIENAYDRSRLAIRDGNVSTFLIAFLLFQMGSGLFKGFGTTLIVTVLITLLVNVPLTKELLYIFYRENKQKIQKKSKKK